MPGSCASRLRLDWTLRRCCGCQTSRRPAVGRPRQSCPSNGAEGIDAGTSGICMGVARTKGRGAWRARMPSINTISLALRCVLGRLKLGAKCVTYRGNAGNVLHCPLSQVCLLPCLFCCWCYSCTVLSTALPCTVPACGRRPLYIISPWYGRLQYLKFRNTRLSICRRTSIPRDGLGPRPRPRHTDPHMPRLRQASCVIAPVAGHEMDHHPHHRVSSGPAHTRVAA